MYFRRSKHQVHTFDFCAFTKLSYYCLFFIARIHERTMIIIRTLFAHIMVSFLYFKSMQSNIFIKSKIALVNITFQGKQIQPNWVIVYTLLVVNTSTLWLQNNKSLHHINYGVCGKHLVSSRTFISNLSLKKKLEILICHVVFNAIQHIYE